MRWYFGFFFVSGFCSILYELVWLRLAMAQFAVTSALVSIVLSAFMIGLGFGSWGAGRYVRSRKSALSIPALRLYALTEALIGLSAILVPYELVCGRILLQKLDAGTPLTSATYYAAAGFWIGLTLVPWCACMGATFPFAMAAIRQNLSRESARSFSYLYLANVLGAVTGAAIPLLLIESLGFRGTLHVGAVLNLCLATSAFGLSLRTAQQSAAAPESPIPTPTSAPSGNAWSYYLLFATGFTSMGVEVVWIRLFTPALGTVVYAFATILGLYLGSTYVGSLIYRRGKFDEDTPRNFFLASLALTVLLPLLLCDPRLRIIYPLRVVAILPFSLAMGFVTPMILDRVSQATRNVLAEVTPSTSRVVSSVPWYPDFFCCRCWASASPYWSLPLPWIAVSFRRSPAALADGSRLRPRVAITPLLSGLIALVLVFVTKDYESRFTPREVRRDSTATVTAAGATRIQKALLVNGMGMTGLTPITKMIAHLPLAFLPRPPKSTLVICFGMGTTHRSALSWNVPSTAVELVPSVVAVFPFFHADANQIMRSPLSHIVIDDGRFFMERSNQQYDVIAIDPPPPVEAAGSSLLYSKQFYSIAKIHLAPDGILQQWFPQGTHDPELLASVAKSLRESFPYVRVFHSIQGWGYHFLASQSPLPSSSAATLASHMPPSAVADMLEWGPEPDAERQFAAILNQELSLDALIDKAPGVPPLQDDRPLNEYYILRRVQDPEYRRGVWLRILARLGGKS